MPSDWPQVFFGERHPPLLPPQPIGTPPLRPAPQQWPNVFHDQPPYPPLTPTQPPPVADTRPAQWPEVFFNKRAEPIAPSPAAPAPARPAMSARIPIPQRPAEDQLPTISLPVRKSARVPVPGAPAVATPVTTSNGHIQAGTGSVVLVTGETISGIILSDKTDMVFLKHDALGVITIPKAAIASRHVRLVLHNGDIVAGEWIVDTPELLVLRSAMLGTLSVPRSSIKALG